MLNDKQTKTELTLCLHLVFWHHPSNLRPKATNNFPVFLITNASVGRLIISSVTCLFDCHTKPESTSIIHNISKTTHTYRHTDKHSRTCPIDLIGQHKFYFKIKSLAIMKKPENKTEYITSHIPNELHVRAGCHPLSCVSLSFQRVSGLSGSLILTGLNCPCLHHIFQDLIKENP